MTILCEWIYVVLNIKKTNLHTMFFLMISQQVHISFDLNVDKKADDGDEFEIDLCGDLMADDKVIFFCTNFKS